MTSDTYTDVLFMALILIGVIVLFGVLWLLVRRCGFGPQVAVEPRGEVVDQVDQSQKATAVIPDDAAGNAALNQPTVNTPSEHHTLDVGSSPESGALSPSQRIAKAARRASVAVSRAVKKETDAILQALSSGADVMQVPSDNVSQKSEGLTASRKEGKAKSKKRAAASDKEGTAEDSKSNKRGSAVSKENLSLKAPTKEDEIVDATTEKPVQGKDDDARNEQAGNVEPQPESRDGAAEQGQPSPRPIGSPVGPSMDGATATATTSPDAKEPLLSQKQETAGPGSGATEAHLSRVQDADVVSTPNYESRRKKSKKRHGSATSSINQSLAQSEVKSDASSKHSKRKRKSTSRAVNRTQP